LVQKKLCILKWPLQSTNITLDTSGKSLGNMLKVTSHPTGKNSLIFCPMNSGRFPQHSHEPGWMYVWCQAVTASRSFLAKH
jgi:hypothetical protein